MSKSPYMHLLGKYANIYATHEAAPINVVDKITVYRCCQMTMPTTMMTPQPGYIYWSWPLDQTSQEADHTR